MNGKNEENPHPASKCGYPSPTSREKGQRDYPSPSLRERLGEGVDLARKLRKNQTDAERALWLLLRNRRFEGLKFRRQYQIGSFIVDFCCVEKKLIIELDGGQHAEQKNKDTKRTEYLQRLGYQVLRFWNNDMLKNSAGVLELIKRKLENPHPASPLKREKGNQTFPLPL